MPLIKRVEKGSALTHAELDGNFSYLDETKEPKITKNIDFNKTLVSGSNITITRTGDEVKIDATSTGGGSIPALIEHQLLFGKADGTIGQSSKLIYNDTTKDFSLGGLTNTINSFKIYNGVSSGINSLSSPTFSHQGNETIIKGGETSTNSSYFTINCGGGNTTTITSNILNIQPIDSISIKSKAILLDPSLGIGHGSFRLDMNGSPAMYMVGSNSNRRTLFSNGQIATPVGQVEIRSGLASIPSLVVRAHASQSAEVLAVKTSAATTVNLFSVDVAGTAKAVSMEFNKLNLSNLPEAASDAAAATAGVEIGYAYINSSTGAVHKRRV